MHPGSQSRGIGKVPQQPREMTLFLNSEPPDEFGVEGVEGLPGRR
ncbi:hypothetical protein FHX37_1577 [Haloactinospora alba]|uniref:Uncharacterized protein n=1 Tax=Haloactinospora alba TaxID=405555 RepID=A0A543NIJ8_9ACTN|nr:hypothetical protein FHX37_1577 [Haloactinospora alba]